VPKTADDGADDGMDIGEPLPYACQQATSKRGRKFSYLMRRRRRSGTAAPAPLRYAVSGLLLLAAGFPATAMNPMPVYNRPVCGTGYVPVDLGKGNYFNVINAPAHNTCVTAERHHLSWYVSSWQPAATNWQYPNISSGIEWGRYTCNDGPSATSSGSKCMRYPVRVDRDGEPVTSVAVHSHIARGNVAYDIWVNRKNVAPAKLRQPDGAEVMIWIAYPGIADDADARHVVIDGIAWDVMTWIAHNSATNTSWRYVAYLAHRQRDSVSRLWLNPFFRDAELAGEMSPSWYLTAIDFGAEINQTVSGPGFDVTHYSLTGVR
jgi:glycosyl hydrolase family 12